MSYAKLLGDVQSAIAQSCRSWGEFLLSNHALNTINSSTKILENT
ncbi:hypothetical protein [Nostoc sp. GT001]|nr:hypothetical protein [Nostoc sp. GT001]MDM9583092.1 hypothetical protein [Nostoc sp. GT001]